MFSPALQLGKLTIDHIRWYVTEVNSLGFLNCYYIFTHTHIHYLSLYIQMNQIIIHLYPF